VRRLPFTICAAISFGSNSFLIIFAPWRELAQLGIQIIL
jgi:hypothetical protein